MLVSDWLTKSILIPDWLIRMAKDPGTVSQFLTELGSKLVPLWTQEQSVMLKMKEDEMKELGRDFDGKLDFWDFR